MIRKLIVNILCCTGITLIVLGAVASLFGGRFLFISSVFQSLTTNIVICTGLSFTQKFESQYAVLEYTLDIGYTVMVVLVSGFIFNWYSSIPIWILIGMSVLVYVIGMCLNIFRLQKDVEEINKLLKQLNCKAASREKTHDTNFEH